MKKILLLAAASLSLSVNAQWVKPTAPSHDIVEGDTVRLLNVEYGAFLGGANAWGTQTSLITPGLDYVLRQSDNGKDWKMETASGTKKGLLVFRDNESGCFIDMGNQNKGFNWTFSKKENGYYTIQSPSDDPNYGGDNWVETQFFGWNGDKNIVYANVDPTIEEDEEGNPILYGIEWAVMTREEAAAYTEALAPYSAAMELKAVIDKAKDEYPSVDCSQAEAVYNNTNSTVEELRAAKKLVANAIAALRSQEVLAGATADSPVDGTELLENPDFSAGDISGWECTFVSGTTATNVGYQGASYNGKEWNDEDTGESGVASVNKFIEAWANNVAEMKRDGKTFATIGDAKLCQTIYGLPAGKYKLSCDVIAVQQYDGSQNPVTGVQLYVVGGAIDSHLDMATGNETPEHFILTFIHSGGDVELGLRTNQATANWIAADNFQIMYYGEIHENPYQLLLKDAVTAAEKKYEDMDMVEANAEVKAAYVVALGKAKDAQDEQTDEYYQNLQAEFDAAVNALQASVKAYEVIAATMEEADERIAQLEKQWPDLASELADLRDSWNTAYEDGTFVTGDEVKVSEALGDVIGKYISENCQAGDDVTVLLRNPGFTKDFSGWIMGGAGVVWQNNYGNGENIAEAAANIEAPAREDGLAEKWHAKFTMTQTIKNMPRGVYTLSCQGFNRHDDGEDDVAAELFAILPDSTIQTAPFADIDDYATEEKLFDNTEGEDKDPTNHWRSDAERNGKWAPNSMTGAAWHFMNKSDGENYDYVSKFNIVMLEAGDLTVGARCEYEHQWVIFDNFRIIYQGSGAAVYEQPIKDLIARGNKILDGAYEYKGEEMTCISKEVADAWPALVAQCDEVWTKSEDECIEAMTKLQAGIKAIEASIALGHKVCDAYDAGNTKMSLVEEAYEIECNEAVEVINAIYDALTGEGYATDADMEAAMTSLNVAFTKDAVAAAHIDEATEEAPADLTAALSNATYEWNAEDRNEYWTNTGKAPHGWNENGVDEKGNPYVTAEVWNGAFTHSQKIYGLPAGFYRLKVNAFQRGAGFNKHSELAGVDSIGEPLTAYLYAGDASTKVASLFSDVDKYAELCVADDGTVPGAKVVGGLYDGKVVPNSMDQAVNAFNKGLYKNVLQFEVKATRTQVAGESDCIEIGLSKETLRGDDWVIFGGWKLEYLGTATPANDPTTEITAVEVAPATRAIFDLTGRKVNKAVKGVFIINGKKVIK